MKLALAQAGRHRRRVPRAYADRIDALRPTRREVGSVELGAGEEIGLGSRRGDVDWLGHVREFSVDADICL